MSSFNRTVAEKITSWVSTMWCAYIFEALALISLPAAIKTGDLIIIVAWIAQTFLQLVLLSIIMVGQNAASVAVAQKIEETHTASLGEFELAKEAQVLAHEQLVEIRAISREMHQLLKDNESSE